MTSSYIGQQIYEGENPILAAVSVAFYKTLEGVDDTIEYIQTQLERYALKKHQNDVENKEIKINAMDFNHCDIVRLKTVDKKYVSYRLNIKEITESNGDPCSSHYLNYEHVLVSKSEGCMRVPSCKPPDDSLFRIETKEIVGRATETKQ